MSARVKYIADRSDPERLEKTKRFQHVLEYFAAVWNIHFAVDAPPRNVSVGPQESGERTVFVHFFNAPYASEYPYFYILRSVFGFEVPMPGINSDEGGTYITRHDVGVMYAPTTTHNSIVSNPERSTIAEVANSHLYILFDLAYQEWDGDALVLSHILAAALPKIFGGEAEAQALAREVLVKKRFHKRLETHFEREKFATMAQAPLTARVAEEEKLWLGAKSSVENFSRILIADGFSLMELEERLKQVERFADRPAAEQEFEKLLSWPSIKGIRIEGNSLAVYTKSLTMENTQGQKFPIGEYKILITPESNPSDFSQWVQAAEHGLRESYRHSAITGKAMTPCWGNVIKPELIKAFQQYDFMYAISDALAFLTVESTGALLNSWGPSSAPNPPDPRPFYLNEEDQKGECRKYVDFIKRFRQRALENRIRKELGDMRVCLNRESKELFEAQAKRISHRNALQVFERCARNFPCEEEFSLLVGLPDLVALEICNGKILALFASHFSKRDSAIKPGFAMIFSDTGDAQVRKLGSGETIECPVSSEERDLLLRLAIFGMFGTALEALYDHMTETPRPFERARKKLEDFLSKNNAAPEPPRQHII